MSARGQAEYYVLVQLVRDISTADFPRLGRRLTELRLPKLNLITNKALFKRTDLDDDRN